MKARDADELDCWWVINGAELLAALKRVADGDDPGLAYVELWANSTSEESQ